MSFYDDLDNAVADIIAAGLFGSATLTSISETFDKRADRTTKTSTTSTIDAIMLQEKVMATNGVLVTQTVAYTRQPVSVNDTITLAGVTSNVQSVSPVNPAGTVALLHRVVLS